MKEVWYNLVALTADGKTIPIGISDMNHTIGITLSAAEIHMNEEQAIALLNYTSTFFNVFKHIRLIRIESTYNEETEETEYVYQIEKEAIR